MSTYRVVRAWVSAAFVAAAVALAWPGSPVVRAQAPLRSFALFRPELAHARPVPRRPRRRGQRRARPAERVLLRRGERRRVEDDRRRPRVDADLRLAAGRVDRRARGRAVGARHVYVGTGESTLRDSMGYGNGMYKSTDAGKTWTHIGLDDTQHIGKIAVDPEELRTSSSSRRSAISTRRTRTAACSARRTAARPGRRCCSRTTTSARSTSRSIRPTRSIVYASLWNTRRPPWYTYQPTNGPGGGIFKSTDGGTTWKQLTNGLPTACVGKTGIAVAPSNPRRVYAVVDDFLPEGAPADTPCPGAPPGRGAGAAAAGAAGAGRGRGAGAAAAAPLRRRSRAASSAPTTPARRGRSCPATPRSGDAAGTSSTSPSIRRTRTSSTCRTSRCRDRRTAARRGCRCADRPAATTTISRGSRPTIPNTMIVASDQGTIITRNAHGRRSARRDLELVAQSADRADLSPLRRLPLSVLGDRRAAGQRRRRRALARQVREDLDARLGADRRRRRERHDGRRSAAPGHRLRRHRHALRSRAQSAAADDGSRSARSRRERTGRSRSCSRRPIRTRCTTRTSSSSRRPTARRRGRRSVRTSRGPIPASRRTSTRSPPRDTDRNGKRGVIYTVAPSPLNAPLIWIGTDDG